MKLIVNICYYVALHVFAFWGLLIVPFKLEWPSAAHVQ